MLIIVLLILFGVLVEKSVIVILQENMHVNSLMYMMRIDLFLRKCDIFQDSRTLSP